MNSDCKLQAIHGEYDLVKMLTEVPKNRPSGRPKKRRAPLEIQPMDVQYEDQPRPLSGPGSLNHIAHSLILV